MKSSQPSSNFTEKFISFFTRLSRREKIFLLAATVVVVLLLSDQVVVRPIFNTFNSLTLKIENLQSEIKKSIRLLSQKERILKEEKEYAVFLIPSGSSEEQTVQLLQHIEELANIANVNLLYAKPVIFKEEEERKKYSMTLECEGKMEQIVRFFYEVENSNQLIKIEKYSLRPAASGSMVIKLAATISRPILR